jgi:Bacterial extracellular solute-binding protein
VNDHSPPWAAGPVRQGSVSTGRTGRPRRYRPGRKRRINTALLTALAAVIAATLLVALGAKAMMVRATCNGQPARVHIAVSGEIEPVITHLGAYFNRQHRQVDGHCAEVAVSAAPAATVAADLARVPTGHPRPLADAWIPDSPDWVDIARATPAAAKFVQPTGITVAESPLLIAMPRPAAARTPAFGSDIGWNFLLPSAAGGPAASSDLDVQFPDPTQSAAGLAALIQLKRMVGYGRAARGALATFALNVQVVEPERGDGSLPSLDTFAQPASTRSSAAAKAPPAAGAAIAAAPVTITTEQAVVQYDRAHPTQPLAVRYPSDGTYQLSFPYVITTANRLTMAAAHAFGKILNSAYATAYVRYEGFRAPAGAASAWPGWYGLARTGPHLLPQPGPGRILAALHAWHVLTLGSRFLTLNDISETMNVQVSPGGPTLEQVLGRSSAAGMTRFPDSTQMGLWVFASHLTGDLPYKQLIPMGPLPAQVGVITRRQAIQQLAASGRPLPGAPAALYGTLLAAYKQMVATYQPQYVNDVLVLTAGIENAPGDISASALIQDLKAAARPGRPVEILMIILGRPGTYNQLQRIVRVTNGKVWPITSAAEVPQILYRAFGRRICQPHCPR